MADKKIMLVCNAGMSTSLLVSKMQKAAEADGLDADIFATASSDADNKIESEHPDILMLGPQVRYLLKSYQSKLDIPVEVINMQDYGLMNGDKVLKHALSVLDSEAAK
ncbi:PTS sugar transporter subunit IIB [Lacticaseibacillus zhaodongensis]|uniref:PTS sugar transporter subunit IIB n=1 Tax=Lacticaseibacillus zhaodongensis TaxID=2668065 RepID=UPI0012D3170F|nr:PTS sugar transporter subunit IIB [Lacticaseibacillus zhaodongensis]